MKIRFYTFYSVNFYSISISFKKSKDVPDILLLSLNGFLNSEISSSVLKEILQRFTDDFNYIICSFEKYQYMATTGLGILSRIQIEAERRKGRLILTSITNPLLDMFELLGFDKMFNIESDNEEALKTILKDKSK